MSVQSQIDRITNEVSAQSDLIEQIASALVGKAGGGSGGDTSKEDAMLDGTLSGEYVNDRITTTRQYALYQQMIVQ